MNPFGKQASDRREIARHRQTRCDGVSRRDFLHVGLLTSLGISAADLLRWQAAGAENPEPGAGRSDAAKRNAKAKACILIWLDGGPSHLDMFDLKPDAPSEIRSQFKAIPSAVPGVHLCEHLPRIAAVMKDVALIRSLTHELGNHNTGSHFMLTGHRPVPSFEYPSLGSWVAHASGFGAAMPPYVAIPGDAVGGESNAARAGFLPAACSAFNVGRDPANVDGLRLPEGVSFARSDRRREMLRKMDAFTRDVERDAAIASDRDTYYEQAYRLITSSDAKAAFDLGRESGQTRERFGHARVGQGCLLARRLVEAGSRFVTVVDTGWDTHQQIFKELPDSRFPGSGKLPALDRAFAALVTDLRERGLLESTLVVLMGEFGRTPKLNSQGGRDHWPRAGSVCLAGGGVQGGRVIGATNAFGEIPVERPVTPPDLACTILRLLGVDPHREIRTPSGRPVKIMADGGFIRELI